MGVHRPAEFSASHAPAFMRDAEPQAWLTVYPFVRSYDWYVLPEDERREMLAEHGGKGREYPQVLSNTVAAFALGDYEWILAFEADELTDLVDLMRHLRATEARRHVREEVPFFTGRRIGVDERRRGAAMTSAGERHDARAATGDPLTLPPRDPRPRTRYDGVLLVGFGGPEGQDDVLPFLRNVTRGRGIPDERLEEVAHHYRHFGGVSPINDAEPRAAQRSGGRAGPPRAGPAGAMGQPQLGPLPGRRAARGARRRAPPPARGRDQRLLVVLELPAVPRGPRGRARGRPG